MLISHKHNFIFIHILKTAGTSVSTIFAHHARLIDTLVYGYWPTQKFFTAFNILFNRKGIELLTGFRKHATALEIRRKLSREVYDNYFKFCFMRNPWDYCVSLYFYLLQNSKLKTHKTVTQMTFDEFIRWYVSRQPKQQADFITDAKGEIIVDYIGRYERITEELGYIAKRLSLDLRALPEKNISKKRSSRDYRRYYDSETVELVGGYYTKDISIMEYSFE